MAQFKRTLFATSYFGKSFTFTGEYYTRVVHAGEPFSGHIDVKIKADLPTMHYPLTSDSWVVPTSWSIDPVAKSAHIQQKGEKLTFFACADKFELTFGTQVDAGTIKLTVQGDDNKNIEEFTINTSDAPSFSFERNYANTWVTIETLDNKSVVIQKMAVRAASLFAEAYTDSVYHSQDPNSLSVVTPIEFPNGLESDKDGYIIGQTAQVVTDQLATSIKLVLATSDTQPLSSPVVDEIIFSSGDIANYSPAGYWHCAINLNNVASDEEVSFKRVKRVAFDYLTPPQAIERNLNWWDDYLAIRSTSRTITTSDTSVPTDTNVQSPGYWQPESATYRQYQKKVVPRASLGHKNNGHFSENKELGSALYGPFNVKTMGYAFTTILNWDQLIQAIGFPTQANGTAVTLQLWDTPDIDRYYPVYERTLSVGDNPYQIALALSETYPELYIRWVLYSTSGTQTPVLDYLELTNRMLYSRTLTYANNRVNAFDNVASKQTLPKAPEGTKLLKEIPISTFNLPAKAQGPRFYLEYTPRYPNQNVVYYGDSDGLQLENTRYLKEPTILRVFSFVQPDEPVASVNDVYPNRLYWHYRYDGGTVIYPNQSQREVGTDFTPNLLSGKRYELKINRGWPKQRYELPRNMTWQTVGELLNYSVEALQTVNPQVILYGENIAAGTSLIIPEETDNTDVNVLFQSTNGLFTEKSIWNASSSNDYTVARVVGDTSHVVDWVSEERFFAGIINPGNKDKSYLRTQSVSQSNSAPEVMLRNTTEEPISYAEIATTYQVALEDLLLANNQLAYYGQSDSLTIAPGASFVLPEAPALPVIPPEVWFEEENPYILEVIPNTIRKTYDGQLLPDNTVQGGSDDEPVVKYRLRESTQRTHTLKRGNYAHGRDALPYSNVNKIVRVTNTVTGEVYSPYISSGNTEQGDYILTGNMIDWSPAHPQASEPKTGEQYTVVFTINTVENLQVLYTSHYVDRISYDALWRSREVKTIKTLVGPNQEKLFDLPVAVEYSDFTNYIKNPSYVIEDDDLWVKSSIQEVDSKPQLLLTLNGKDPKRNWHPTVQTGFYYLNNQEHYLYSEPIQHHYAEEDLPIIEDVTYSALGLRLVDSEGKPMSKNLAPPLEYWTKNNGTVIENNEVTIPVNGSFQAFIPWDGSTNQVKVGYDVINGRNILVNFVYFAEDKITPVNDIDNQGSSNGYTSILTPGTRGNAMGYYTINSNVKYVRVTLSGNPIYVKESYTLKNISVRSDSYDYEPPTNYLE